ncbi:MAG TPA: 2-oxoacid:acceptor oxidoreductase subunit alpha [Acidobacteriota bacterium]|nr:2-oxoacid:acceptor oxidoreductase subunit alpha [Acidobacteriota bacterium]HQM64028.1 2-oxoacid:acceptor oxidoreductase subunit alpha [Acidobacteriota bacterium]
MKIKEVRFVSGNEACAIGAIAAGCTFFGGYPISPSSEIAEFLAELLPANDGRFIQMEDEIAAMGSIIGASLAGAKVMTATSGPGFSLKQENLGFACMAEVPCVIVNVMRGGPSTGAPTSPAQADILQSRWGTHGDHPIIVTCPTTVQEIFLEVIRAFNLAERFRNPVLYLLDEINAHMREKIEIPEASELELIRRPAPPQAENWGFPYRRNAEGVPLMPDFGTGHRCHVTGLDHGETGFPTGNAEIRQALHHALMAKIDKNAASIYKNDLFMVEDAETLIIAFGSTARSARRAVELLRKQGRKVGLFRPITLYPIPEADILKAAEGKRKIVVPEMNLGQYVLEIRRILGHDIPIAQVNRTDGEPITPDQIMAAV